MFNKHGRCDYCKDIRYATVTILDDTYENEICFYCLEEKFDEKYSEEEK
jgi:hypothetical protein